MRLSDKGLDLIKGFESYLVKQGDGSCKAYRCPAGKWTCGWGCTEGVGPLTHWTKDEATEAISVEMRKHEKEVERLVKVPLTQGQFDALVSFSYNTGALAKSTLLKHLNNGDYARAASHFMDWKKARVQGASAKLYKVAEGTLITLPGLVTRRAAEAAMFLEAAHIEMAQDVEPEQTKLKMPAALGLVGAPAATGAAAISTLVPAVPAQFTDALANVGAWKSLAAQAAQLPAEMQAVGFGGAVSMTIFAAIMGIQKMRGQS